MGTQGLRERSLLLSRNGGKRIVTCWQVVLENWDDDDTFYLINLLTFTYPHCSSNSIYYSVVVVVVPPPLPQSLGSHTVQCSVSEWL